MGMLRKMLKMNGELFDRKTDESGHKGQSFHKEDCKKWSITRFSTRGEALNKTNDEKDLGVVVQNNPIHNTHFLSPCCCQQFSLHPTMYYQALSKSFESAKFLSYDRTGRTH